MKNEDSNANIRLIYKFNTKIDWWIGLILSIVPITSICMIIRFFQFGGGTNAIVGLIMLIVSVIIVPLYFITYILDEKDLIVKICFFYVLKIAYSSITSVKETKNPLSSLAMSIDRIEIKFGNGDCVLISPKNKKEFLKVLRENMESK